MKNQWWDASGAVLRISPKHDKLTLRDILDLLPVIKGVGFHVLELFAPYHGGNEYHGLDGIAFSEVDPEIGDWRDFKALMDCSHSLGLRVVLFINLGYTAQEHPAFLKAERDLAVNRRSSDAEWFLWSDTPSFEFHRPLAPWFLQDAHGSWEYSETAGKYYWCKWKGQHGDARLPQLNFASPAWQAACKDILRTWRRQDADGFVIDAVNWYMNCDWQINHDCIKGPLIEDGEIFLQPEGAGGFGDDPVVWIEKGGYNCVQDYSLGLWWENDDPLGDAIKSGNPEQLEVRLARCRDRVVLAGGITYNYISDSRNLNEAESKLRIAFLLLSGTMLCFDYRYFLTGSGFKVDEEVAALLRLQCMRPALAPSAGRKRLFTDCDHACMAMMRQSNHESVLIAFNFSDQYQEITVYISSEKQFLVKLSPLGYYCDLFN